MLLEKSTVDGVRFFVTQLMWPRTAASSGPADGLAVRTRAGHRVLTHSGDVAVEAWAPSRTGCLEELVRGVVETFGDLHDPSVTRTMPFRVGVARDQDLVLALLDDVFFLFDSDGFMVADLALNEGDDGNLYGTYSLVPVDTLATSISVPRGTVRSDVQFALDGSVWRARVVIDVRPD